MSEYSYSRCPVGNFPEEPTAPQQVPVTDGTQRTWDLAVRALNRAEKALDVLKEREQTVLVKEANLRRRNLGNWAWTALLVALTFLLIGQGNRMLPEPMTRAELQAYGGRR